MDVDTPILSTTNPLIIAISCNNASGTKQKNVPLTVEQSETTKGVKKRRLFDSDHE
jgi:hypothetical protein